MDALLRGPQTGGYGVTDLPGWFPWCIRHLTHSPWAHAFIVLDAAAGIILEANPTGSVIAGIGKYDGRPVLYSEPAPGLPQAPASPALTAQARERWTGIGYGFADVAELGLWYAMHIRLGWLTRLVLDDHRMICSQLVAEWGAAYGADWRCGQPDEQFVTPGMLGARLA